MWCTAALTGACGGYCGASAARGRLLLVRAPPVVVAHRRSELAAETTENLHNGDILYYTSTSIFKNINIDIEMQNRKKPKIVRKGQQAISKMLNLRLKFLFLSIYDNPVATRIQFKCFYKHIKFPHA